MHTHNPAHNFKSTLHHRKLAYLLRVDRQRAPGRCPAPQWSIGRHSESMLAEAAATGKPLCHRRTPLRELDQVAERVRALLGYSSLDTVD